jgi:hypothetical protein
MVFDASKSKLNAALFAPWFSLATPDSMARTVDVGYHGADNDYGENVLQLLAARGSTALLWSI